MRELTSWEKGVNTGIVIGIIIGTILTLWRLGL